MLVTLLGITTLDKAVIEKASSPIYVTLFGMTIQDKDVHPQKASLQITFVFSLIL